VRPGISLGARAVAEVCTGSPVASRVDTRDEPRYDSGMEWSDEGVVLSVRPHGESAAVLELFTRQHGRHLGLVHGGRSRKLRPVLQIGNHVDAGWKARLADNLGHFTVELRKGFAALLMEDAAALTAMTSMATLARLLPERDPHPNLFEITLFVLSFIDDDSIWPALYARWEMALLDELGMGLDLSSCAATGATTDLVWVSPKSGRAVSAQAGEPYRGRLLRLPGFLGGLVKGAAAPGPDDIRAGLALTGYFLEQRVLAPREQAMPEARGRLVELICR
jgi:DNA repair protein RecO (recombination protein O)